MIFFIEGKPVGQPRPKSFARKFGDKWQARVYDPGTAEAWKQCVFLAAAAAMKTSSLHFPAGAAVRVTMNFYFARPKSHFKADGNLAKSAPRSHLSRPDADNLAKAVLDALTQAGIWLDDSQVDELFVSKAYAEAPPNQGCEVEVEFNQPPKPAQLQQQEIAP